MDLYKKLGEVIGALVKHEISYALCGGMAMAVYNLPRATIDIDLLIEESTLEQAKKIAKDLGYSKEVGLMEFANGAVKLYRLTMFDPEFSDILPLDFLLVTPKIHGVWKTRKKVKWEFGDLWVVSKEGLIKLKSFRKSGQDQDDIKHLKGIK